MSLAIPRRERRMHLAALGGRPTLFMQKIVSLASSLTRWRKDLQVVDTLDPHEETAVVLRHHARRRGRGMPQVAHATDSGAGSRHSRSTGHPKAGPACPGNVGATAGEGRRLERLPATAVRRP